MEKDTRCSIVIDLDGRETPAVEAAMAAVEYARARGAFVKKAVVTVQDVDDEGGRRRREVPVPGVGKG